jgi:hypothetical protein
LGTGTAGRAGFRLRPAAAEPAMVARPAMLDSVVTSRARPQRAAGSTALEAVRGAIARKDQVIAQYRGVSIAFCPHVLALGADEHFVLAFVILGDVAASLSYSSPKRWRWLTLRELGGWHCRSGGVWFTAPRETRPPLRTVTIEAEATP